MWFVLRKLWFQSRDTMHLKSFLLEIFLWDRPFKCLQYCLVVPLIFPVQTLFFCMIYLAQIPCFQPFLLKIIFFYLNIILIGAYSVSVGGKLGLKCDVIGGGSPVFRRRVAPRPGSVLIILSKNIVKNMSVWPEPSPRGHTLAVMANRFLTHYAYAYTHYVTFLAFLPYFTVGSMTYEF